MQNIGQETFDYGSFKAAYDADPTVQALTHRYDQNGIELNTKNSSSEETPTDTDQAKASVGQMAKRATAHAQKA